MGFWSTLFGAAAGAAAVNATQPPTVVISDPEYVVKGLKPKGMNSWEIRIGKRSESGSGHPHTVSRSTHGFNSGSAQVRLYWS